MNTLTMFNLSDNAKTVIGNAELDKRNAAQSGVNAVLALSWDNVHHVFRHGDAAKLADVLKANGFKSAVSKFYSEKTATVCAFAQRKALLSVAGMARGEEKTAAYKDAVAQALKDLGALKSVSALMAAVKPPKADEKTDEKTDEKPAAVVDLARFQMFFDLLAVFARGFLQAHELNEVATMEKAGQLPRKSKKAA